MKLLKQNRLFDLDEIPITKSKSQIKRNWFIKFKKYCENEYDKYGSLRGRFCCGCMRLCEYCTQEKLKGCSDCVDAVKKYFYKNNKEIDYNDFSFSKIIDEIEDS